MSHRCICFPPIRGCRRTSNKMRAGNCRLLDSMTLLMKINFFPLITNTLRTRAFTSLCSLINLGGKSVSSTYENLLVWLHVEVVLYFHKGTNKEEEMEVALGVGRRQLIKKDGTNSRDILAPRMSAFESKYRDLMHFMPLDGYITFLGSKLQKNTFFDKTN